MPRTLDIATADETTPIAFAQGSVLRSTPIAHAQGLVSKANSRIRSLTLIAVSIQVQIQFNDLKRLRSVDEQAGMNAAPAA
jgi:hypothetical protein